MKERDEFDDYIKGLFSKDPVVPAELEWEAMDIEIPKATKPNRKFWSILLLLLLFASTSIIFLTKKRETKKQNNEVVTIDEETNKIITNSNNKQNENRTLTSNKAEEINTLNTNTKINEAKLADLENIELETQLTLAKPKKDVNLQKQDETFKEIKTVNAVTNEKNYVNNFEPKADKKTTKTNEVIISQLKNEPIAEKLPLNDFSQNQPIKIDTKQKVDITSSEIVTYKNNNTNLNNSLGSIAKNEFKETTTSPNTKALVVKQNVLSQINVLPLISANNLSADNESIELTKFRKFSNKNTPKNKIAFVLSYGYNTFNLKIEETNVLKDKLNNVFGNSFKTGIKINLNKNWKTNVLLSFNQFHSTFEHTRDLETVFDTDNFLKIKRKEITYHNNYTNTLGLEVGVERNLYTIDRFHLLAGVALTPTYALSATGKTTNNTLVEKLVYDSKFGKISMGGSINIGAVYSVNKSISLEAAYQFNKLFINEIFINNNITTNQFNIFTLGISYRL